MFVLTKEMIDKLRQIRENANLTQQEVATRMGIKSKAGQSYIAQIESGLIKNPTIGTIMDYLNACGAGRVSFFTEINKILEKQTHQEIMSQAKLSDETANKRVGYKTLAQKIDRDTALYANKIKYQKKPEQKINLALLKDKIEKKVLMLLSDHKTDTNLIPTYLDFTSHIIKRALNPDPNPPLNTSPWIKSGIKQYLFAPITKIVYTTIRIEKKKLLRRKIPSSEKQKKMASGFLNYRVIIEQVEFEVHKLLNDLMVSESLFLAYKDYARACYSALKKSYIKDPSLLTQKFAEIKRAWKLMGLNEEVMEKVKETTVRVYKVLVTKAAIK